MLEAGCAELERPAVEQHTSSTLVQLQALRKLTAFTINMAYNLEPLYSIAIAAILFGELQEVGFSFWVGICLIVLSVVLQTYTVFLYPPSHTAVNK